MPRQYITGDSDDQAKHDSESGNAAVSSVLYMTVAKVTIGKGVRFRRPRPLLNFAERVIIQQSPFTTQ